jgi:hypothetical protein
MAKIRDLGISIIPATMQPPEVGSGGGHKDGCGDNSGVCVNCSDVSSSTCEAPTSAPGKERKEKDTNKKRKAGAFSDDSVMQLKRQLRNRLENQI